VLVAQLSINELDTIVTSNRRWRHEGLGVTGEAYLVGPDFLIRSSPRMFFENRDLYFEELKGGQTPEHDIEDIRRYGTPVLQQHVDTKASRAALGGVEGTGEILAVARIVRDGAVGRAWLRGSAW